ncbi:MAG: type II secretion system F family protein [Acidobacteria bacterium]|nr:type II secretion system F family protein [Acidobacteriota bacterium]
MTEFWILAGFFAFVMALTVLAGYALVLRPAAATPVAAPVADHASPKDVLAETVRRVGEQILARRSDADALRKRLVAAGYRSSSTVPLYSGLKVASALLLAIMLGWTVLVVRQELSSAVFMAFAAAAFGYTVPEHILGAMVKARRERIRQALPDAQDLLVLCIESGQSFDQALVETSRVLRSSYPDLSGEVALAHLEVRAGTGRAEALRNLADRNQDPELRKLVNLLIQSDRFGASLAPALRVHSKYLRLRSKQQAEETARKISVKLLFPIFFLIFPCMLLVTAGPAVIQIITQVLPMLQ